jgi:hypothetical protein
MLRLVDVEYGRRASDTVEALEDLLDLARRGELHGGLIFATRMGKEYVIGMTGECRSRLMEASALLSYAQKSVSQAIEEDQQIRLWNR